MQLLKQVARVIVAPKTLSVQEHISFQRDCAKGKGAYNKAPFFLLRCH
jgi:hypothetical protein